MKVSEYIGYLVDGEAFQLSIKDVGDMSHNPDVAPTDVQIANQNKFIKYINLANIEVHKRFYLVRKEYEIDNPLAGEEYKLPPTFLVPITAYYTEDGEEVAIDSVHKNIISGVDTAVSLLFPEPFVVKVKGTDEKERSQIILEYAASPKEATKASSDLGISNAYLEAILNYAAYKAHSSVNGDIKAENNTYLQRYERACKQIENSSMTSNTGIDQNTKLEDNGFV